METYSDNEKTRLQLQEFMRMLNREPDPTEFQPTPDGKAKTLPISYVEMTLDEIYLGQWDVSDTTYTQVFNEVVGTGLLTVWNPITGKPTRRSGFASIVITQDKDALLQDFNSTKKKNALDLSFPKLKAEITKNAAQTLGKVFGRDMNRKQQDTFKPAFKTLTDEGFKTLLERVEKGERNLIAVAESTFVLDDLQKEMLKGTQTKQLNGSVR